MSRTDGMRTLVEQLLAERTARNTAVTTLRQETGAFRHTVRNAHATMAQSQSRRAADNRRQVATGRQQMAKEVAAFRTSTQAAHQALAHELDEQLSHDRTALATETVAFLQNVQKAQADMVKAQSESLAASHADMQATVAQLAAETAAFIQSVRGEHAAMAKSQSQQLAADRQQLAAETAQVRQNAADLLGAIHADTANAAAAWRLMATSLAAKESPAPAAAKSATDEPVAEKKNDPLSSLRGIGLVTQERLYAANIRSYAQLAAATPDELRAAIGPSSARLSNPEHWIEQANQKLGGH